MFDVYEEARARGYLDGLQNQRPTNRDKFSPERRTAYDKGLIDGKKAAGNA